MGDQYLCVSTVEDQKDFRFAYGMMLPSRPVPDVPAIDYAYLPQRVLSSERHLRNLLCIWKKKKNGNKSNIKTGTLWCKRWDEERYCIRSDTIVIYRMILKILHYLCMQCLASHVVRLQTL